MEYFLFCALGYVISTIADITKIKELKDENEILCNELAKIKAENNIIDIQ